MMPLWLTKARKANGRSHATRTTKVKGTLQGEGRKGTVHYRMQATEIEGERGR